MHDASGLAYVLGRTAATVAPWLALAALLMGLLLGIFMALQSLAPEPLLLSPLRWTPTRMALLGAGSLA
jgi:hypothetical protein